MREKNVACFSVPTTLYAQRSEKSKKKCGNNSNGSSNHREENSLGAILMHTRCSLQQRYFNMKIFDVNALVDCFCRYPLFLLMFLLLLLFYHQVQKPTSVRSDCVLYLVYMRVCIVFPCFHFEFFLSFCSFTLFLLCVSFSSLDFFLLFSLLPIY